MARENKTQYAVLGCLLIKPMTAYEIKSFLQQNTRHFWAEGEGQLYPTLKKLTDENCVKFQEAPAEKSGVKKIYSITVTGKKSFNEWFNGKTANPSLRNPMLLKVFFGRSQSNRDMLKVLVECLAEIERSYQALLDIKKIVDKKASTGIDVRYYRFTLEYGIQMTKAELNWIKSTMAEVARDVEKSEEDIYAR